MSLKEGRSLKTALLIKARANNVGLGSTNL